MISVIQRVSSARVEVCNQTIAQIGRGILALVGIEKEDGPQQCDRMLQRLLGYRIFPDRAGKMNLGLKDIQGGLLLVPQFTLVADTSRGMRPGFSSAASPAQAERVFSSLYQRALDMYPTVKKGEFSADMQVQLVNDGPATFYLRCA
jgi:D-tyrosyl-tRNA(Tyr) deacylase